jgi:hypothetical protein
MIRLVRLVLATIALVALCAGGARAQGAAAGQKPPDTKVTPEAQAQARDAQAKPADVKAPELTAEQKAFNAIAEEKDAQKRVGLYEKFVADYPKADMLVSLARTEIRRTTLATLKSSSAKYLDVAKKEIDTAKSGTNPTQLPSTYARFASEMLTAGVLLDEAEDFARQSVSLMDEQKYVDYQKQMDRQLAEAIAKRAANPTPAPSPARPAGGISIRSVNGAPTVQPTPPRPAAATPTAPRPQTPPTMRTDEELRAGFKTMRASNLATLGRVLMKRNKTAEGEKVLKEAYAAKPPAATVAAIAKVLAESAKKAGDEAGQMEYLTVLALSGRITADDQKDFDAVYRKSHNGSLDGVEAMLDARYAKENPRFAVTPADRKAAPDQRAVLAENFTGSG